MAVVGNLLVNLSLESRQFLQGIQQATARTAAATSSIQTSMQKLGDLGKGLAAVFAVDWLAGQVQSSLDYADAIVDLSDATGVGTKTLQEFRYAAQLSGSSVEAADAAVAKFAKNMGEAKNGNEAMRKQFAELGITSGDIDTAIRQAADAIEKLDDKQKQSAATMALFGKSAGTLTNLLSGGSTAFDELATAAQRLGIVLSDDVLRNAGQVNDQLDSLKMILSAQMANTVAQNATSIAGLASSMATLTGAILRFWQSNPEATLAILGALGGFKLGGGWGALIGGIGGAALGYGARQQASEIDMSLPNRTKQLEAATARVNEARAEARKPNPRFSTFLGSSTDRSLARRQELEDSLKELKRQQALMTQAQAMAAAPTKLGTSTGTGTIAAPSVKPVKSTKPSGPSAAEIEKRFNDELSRSYVDYLRAQEDLETDVVERAALQREQLAIETEAHRRDILADKDMTAAQKAQLVAMLDKTEYERADLINRHENEALAQERLDIALAANDNERSVLSGAQSLARTQDERRRIGLRLVDLEYQRERLGLEAIIASHEATETEKKIAAAKLAVLSTIQNNDREGVLRSTMGPLTSYLDGIPKSAEEINEALEGVATNGLERLNDGLADAIMGTGSLKDAFADMTSFIISEIIKIALKAAIIEPLGRALSGLGGGGGIGGFFAGLFGKRANGGYTPAGSYLVGERGPELVNIGATANVTPNHAIRSLGGGRNTTINSTVYGVNDPHMVRRTAQESIMAAMPVSTKLASDRTLRDVRRPKMR